MGVDPTFLARAALDPEQYGPLLDAIVKDTSGHMKDVVNNSEKELKELGIRLEAAGLVIFSAVEAQLDHLDSTMKKALRKALTDPIGEVRELAMDIGYEILRGIQDGMKGEGGEEETFKGGGGGDSGGRGASGTWDEPDGPHGASGTWGPSDRYGRPYGDPHYGQDFIPTSGTGTGDLIFQNQMKSAPTYQGGSNAQFRPASTSSSKTTYIGPNYIQAKNYDDFKKQMEREEQMSNLTSA